MAVRIGHARISEKGTVEGVAGDQNGHEVEVSEWYSGGWLAVYRPNNEATAELIAMTCELCCCNNNIGYSQEDRLSLYKQASAHSFNITEVTAPCNTDCSALVSVCVNAAGIPVAKDMTTRTEDVTLMGTGRFTRLQANKFLTECGNLKRGDILRKSGHTAIVVKGGDNPEEPVKNHTQIYADYHNKEYAGKYRAETDLYMREGGAVTYRTMCVIFEGNPVYCYGYYSVDDRGIKWLYCEYALNGIIYTGFVSTKYLVKEGDI